MVPEKFPGYGTRTQTPVSGALKAGCVGRRETTGIVVGTEVGTGVAGVVS